MMYIFSILICNCRICMFLVCFYTHVVIIQHFLYLNIVFSTDIFSVNVYRYIHTYIFLLLFLLLLLFLFLLSIFNLLLLLISERMKKPILMSHSMWWWNPMSLAMTLAWLLSRLWAKRRCGRKVWRREHPWKEKFWWPAPMAPALSCHLSTPISSPTPIKSWSWITAVAEISTISDLVML